MVFVEAMADDVSRVRNVFVAAVENGKLGWSWRPPISGNHGNGDRFMVLENGRRYEVEPGTRNSRSWISSVMDSGLKIPRKPADLLQAVGPALGPVVRRP